MTDEQAIFHIDIAKLYALLGPVLGRGGGSSGQPDPDNPLKPGPWDPVIRVALTEVLRFGPSPEPWRYGPQPEQWLRAAFGAELLSLIAQRFPAVWDVVGATLRPGEEVSLNPQPLPPAARLTIALGDALVTRTEMLAEFATAFGGEQIVGQTGGERGIIIVGGYVGRFIDEYCGTGFRIGWPFPGPPPRWFRREVGAHDLLLLGATLHNAAERAFDPSVRQALGDASRKLAEAGIERLG